jgi:hypothetical protein
MPEPVDSEKVHECRFVYQAKAMLLTTDHEFDHEALHGFHHVVSIGRVAASVLRGSDEWGHSMSGNHIANEHRRVE